MKADPLDGKTERFLAPSIALFEVVDDDLLPLKIIGIQLSQGKEATPIFTPDDPEYTWKIAKAAFEASDFMYVIYWYYYTSKYTTFELV